jgi:hypothetical protein
MHVAPLSSSYLYESFLLGRSLRSRRQPHAHDLDDNGWYLLRIPRIPDNVSLCNNWTWVFHSMESFPQFPAFELFFVMCISPCAILHILKSCGKSSLVSRYDTHTELEVHRIWQCLLSPWSNTALAATKSSLALSCVCSAELVTYWISLHDFETLAK